MKEEPINLKERILVKRGFNKNITSWLNGKPCFVYWTFPQDDCMDMQTWFSLHESAFKLYQALLPIRILRKMWK